MRKSMAMKDPAADILADGSREVSLKTTVQEWLVSCSISIDQERCYREMGRIRACVCSFLVYTNWARFKVLWAE